MPLQQILPTWLALNNANFQSPTGLTDFRTGNPFPAGGLNAGDYFDITNMEAQQVSYTPNGLLLAGRYRLVLVDSGANASLVATGTIGYLRNGSTVTGGVTLTTGSGQTPGTYSIAASGGGGNGAVLQVVIGSNGQISGNPTLLFPGAGYSSIPTFTVAAGGTPGTIQGQISSSPNVVTSYDVATGAGGAGTIRPVVFLNSITPGYYGFVQELGLASVLGNATIGGGGEGGWVDSTTNGTVTTRAATGSPIGATIGRAQDVPVASQLFKVYLTGPVFQD